jgi:hypothetical protein
VGLSPARDHVVFTFTIRQRIVMTDEARVSPVASKTIAVISVLLWSGVGIMGRGIGFF